MRGAGISRTAKPSGPTNPWYPLRLEQAEPERPIPQALHPTSPREERGEENRATRALIIVDRADHVHRARPPDDAQRLGDGHHLPAARAAALHHLRRAADGGGWLVQFLQLERLRPAGEVHRPQELRLSDRQRRLRAFADQQRPHHCGLAPRPVAAGARRRLDGRRTGRRRCLVPDDLLPALCARGCRGGPDLALHVRRQLRADVRRSPGCSACRRCSCSPARTGRSRPS